MHAFQRGEAPALLAHYQEEITEKYVAEKTADSRHEFKWPHREGKWLLEVVRTELEGLTDSHCSYCDSKPIGATGKKEVDHFKPKSRSEFFKEVVAWDNLYFVCKACNDAKAAKWHESLLRPDGEDFDFLKYFTYRNNDGALEPNAGASTADQAKAQITIDVMGLNRPDLCESRLNTAEYFQLVGEPQLERWGFHFLLQFCRTSSESVNPLKNGDSSLN